jgi:hypothetical protein
MNLFRKRQKRFSFGKLPGLLVLLFCLRLSGSVSASIHSYDSTEVFLISCSPGNNIVTVYGHSAIRIVRNSTDIDLVYSWGVYDFNTPNFTWKFAKGRLNYELEEVPYQSFLQQYYAEQRSVISQKINLSNQEADSLSRLIEINMQAGNRLYLYDFFYDNCATRIRDIIEKTLGKKVVYPDEVIQNQPTFRERLNEAQKPIPWLSLATDLLIGKSGDITAGFRERMFLPEDLQKNLSLTMILEKGKLIPLLQKPLTILDFTSSFPYRLPVLTPLIILCILLLIIILLSIFFRGRKLNDYMDRMLFFIFSIFSILMVFFNFFTDHPVMKTNLNIIWLNPIILIAFVTLFTKAGQTIWFKIILISIIGFVVTLIIIPQSINASFVPIILILFLRSAVRSRFRIGRRLKFY